MAPLIAQLQAHPFIVNKTCNTGQHKEMLAPILELFKLTPDYDLNTMNSVNNLAGLTANILMGVNEIIKNEPPDLVLVHGDTTTTLAASLAAYYNKIPLAHIEAGLRTGDRFAPWPEEANRKLTASLANLNFAPTESARDNLIKEGFDPNTIFVTGNTVIDALLDVSNRIDQTPNLMNNFNKAYPFITKNRKIILVTSHRRENFGEGFNNICAALSKIAREHSDIDIVYPVHLNPSVQLPVKKMLAGYPNIHLITPMGYLEFVYLMKKSAMILTDSGGIQEEAPALGKPVLVLRNITERQEAIDAGTAKLVGTNVDEIFFHVTQLLNNSRVYEQMSSAKNPYGNGNAAMNIVETISNIYLKPIRHDNKMKISTQETELA